MEATVQTVNPAALQVNRNVDDNPRLSKRPRTDYSTMSHSLPPSAQSPFYSPPPAPHHVASSSRQQVIDLTDSPPQTPAFQYTPNPVLSLPPDLPPRTPVCIGQLSVTALILYPIDYCVMNPRPLHGGGQQTDWAPVRLQYEHNPAPVRPDGAETVHLKVPSGRAANGDPIHGAAFGVVEQKIATSLGPMLGKGLIRLDANIKRGLLEVRDLS